MKITINNQEIPLRFSYSLIRALAAKWSMTDLEAVLNKIMTALSNAETDVFEAVDIVAEIVVVAAKLNGNEVTIEDAGDVIFADPQIITDVVKSFIESMPKVSKADVEAVKKKV